MNIESVEKCAVPNCCNTATTGISFPKQKDLKQKWLESLQILHFEPDTNSFVCLDHFTDADIVNRLTGDADLETVLQELPIPVICEKAKNTTESETNICGDNLLKSQENSEEFISYNGTEVAPTTNPSCISCRLCMLNEADTNIFETLEQNIAISTLISSCIPQIKLTQNDNLSKWICKKCLDILRVFYDFREKCIKMDQIQKENFKNSRKRKIIKEPLYNRKKNFCKSIQQPEIIKSSFELPVKSGMDLDRKFAHVEAELMKALEGKLPEEMKTAENIIIEVQSDEETDQSHEGSAVNDKNVVRVGSEEVRLPKGIKVSVNQKETGETCNTTRIQGICNSQFCLVDGYLFEYRLSKGSIQHLRCLVPRCKAIAQQTMMESGDLENTAVVKTAHNHLVPSEDERKKQIFLHLMRRRMHTDKTLNFRNVYEEFCEKDPDIKRLVPLKSVINQICCQQLNLKTPTIHSFEQFFDLIENDEFQKLHFTQSNSQFYQERLAANDGSKAIVFANCDTIDRTSGSKIMYVDASFKIDTHEEFTYHLVSVLVWVTDSFYPIMFALINEKSQEIYKLIFTYLHDNLASNLKPEEIVTDYEAALYYSLGETYQDSHIGGSVFYYTQNLYKKICSLNLSRELETNSCFRNIYHMILMLPLLPVNTILDGLNNIELQATEMGQAQLAAPIFEYLKSQWIGSVTPELFCVHRLENRINENVIAPFKKLRDFIMLSKGKMHKQQINIVSVVEKLIELEGFLSTLYAAPSKKSFARDLSSSQKKNVIRAWNFIENHPKININHFFTKVLGYIKCMENQLWIWGFYRYTGNANDELISAANFSIVNCNDDHNYEQQYVNYVYHPEDEVVVDVVIDQKDGFLVKETPSQTQVGTETGENFQDAYIE